MIDRLVAVMDGLSATIETLSSAFVAVIIGVIVMGVVQALYSYFRYGSFRALLDRDALEETAEQRIRRLASSLDEAAEAIDEIRAEIRERQQTATQLQQEIRNYERLKQVGEQEAQAIAQLLGGVVKSEGRRSFWRDVIFFVAGVAASVVTTLLIG